MEKLTFNFLALPTEIKLIICRFLSFGDMKSLSQVSEDYKSFTDDHFICDLIRLPRHEVKFSDGNDRYILSMIVDRCPKDQREKTGGTLGTVNLVNITELKKFVHADEFFDSCALTLHVFENALYIQFIDIFLFKHVQSLKAMETLAKNSPYLKEVVLRCPGLEKNLLDHPEASKYSLSCLLSALLAKSSIITLRLVDFHLDSIYWMSPDGTFLKIQSKSLKTLVLASQWGPNVLPIAKMELVCPNLVTMRIDGGAKSDRSGRMCLYHRAKHVPGLAFSLTEHSPKLRYFNCHYLKKHWRIMSRILICRRYCPEY